MIDALSIAQALLRCPSVTPADAGALGVLEALLKVIQRGQVVEHDGEPGVFVVEGLLRDGQCTAHESPGLGEPVHVPEQPGQVVEIRGEFRVIAPQ